jgi:hypothetical protein
VILKDPLPYPDFIIWEKSLSDAKSEEITEGEKEVIFFTGISAVVESWDIKDFDYQNPPATPREPVIKLLVWLIEEIGKMINGIEDIPKE